MPRTFFLTALFFTTLQVQAATDTQTPEFSKQDAELVGTGIVTSEELTALYALLKHATQKRS